MNWITDRNSYLVAVGLYGISLVYAVFLLRQDFREDNRMHYLTLLGAFVFHTTAMLLRGFQQGRCPTQNLYEASLFISWTIVTVYLVLGLWPRLRFLGAFASPILFILGVFALMPTLDAPHREPTANSGIWISLHAALVLLAYGTFGLSSVAALMYLIQEHDLKLHKLRALLRRFPPIQRLESIIGELLAGGLALLTAGLMAGAFGLKAPAGTPYWSDPKVQWSGLVWLLYAAVLVLRWRYAQRGRRLAWGAIGGFAFILLTFWSFNLLSPIHHP